MVADIPGLIEGAHGGVGLGDEFLRHVERTAVLIHVVDVSGASGRDPVEDLDTVRRELSLFHVAMLDKPQLIAANKIDALDEPKRLAALQARAATLGLPCLAISAVPVPASMPCSRRPGRMSRRRGRRRCLIAAADDDAASSTSRDR